MLKPDPDRHIFIGMPGYGNQTACAGRAFWRATKLPDNQVYHRYNEGSLLAANFNALWANALTRVHRGKRLDYFGMQHDDIAPQDWWFDAAVEELEANDLDILGVVSPIKDLVGLSSLALDRPDGDTWRPLCRLTMSEVHRLPPTFTSKDVGAPLLLNTGLWVCKFDLSWAKKVRFMINDRIVFSKPENAYLGQVEPEDWYFSRLCHEMGLKIGATTKIKLQHRGSIDFPNDRIWGAPHDEAYVDKSVVPDDGFHFPVEVRGWLTRQEGKELATLAFGRRVLEIGSFCGLSTICLGRTAASVVAVDPHDGRVGIPVQGTLGEFLANLERYKLRPNVRVIVGTTGCLERELTESERFDLVFIDGAHDFESVRTDIECAMDRLSPGGLIVFHDYRNGTDPDVTEAVDELLERGGKLVSVVDSLAVVRPPALITQEA